MFLFGISITNLASPAEAQLARRTVEVGLQAGGAVDTRGTEEQAFGLLLRSLSYFVTDSAQMGLAFGEAIRGDGELFNLFRLHANTLLAHSGTTRPYAGAHCGGMFRFGSNVGADGLCGPQVGVKILAGKRFAIQVEASYSLSVTAPENGFASILAGVTWFFPGEQDKRR